MGKDKVLLELSIVVLREQSSVPGLYTAFKIPILHGCYAD